MKKNKKGIVGSVPVIFFSTILIVIIIILFSIGSYVVKQFGNIKAGILIDDKNHELDIDANALGYLDSINLKLALSCTGDFEGSRKSTKEMISLWTLENTEEVKKFFEKNCANYFEYLIKDSASMEIIIEKPKNGQPDYRVTIQRSGYVENEYKEENLLNPSKVYVFTGIKLRVKGQGNSV